MGSRSSTCQASGGVWNTVCIRDTTEWESTWFENGRSISSVEEVAARVPDVRAAFIAEGIMLTESQISELERRLLDERRDAAQTVEEMDDQIGGDATSDGDLSKMPTHLADRASDVQEEEMDVEIAERQSERLAVIDDALTRLREEPRSYDISVISGRTIPFERLRMVPWTRVLADEKESAEADPRQTGTDRTR